jgi:uncharacterized DUF497 family protein
MPMPWIRSFVGTTRTWRTSRAHAVSPDEVEEALVGEPLVLRGPDDRDLAYGRTEHDRWVFAVYVTWPRGRIRVFTARDITGGERRLYRTHEGHDHESTSPDPGFSNRS